MTVGLLKRQNYQTIELKLYIEDIFDHLKHFQCLFSVQLSDDVTVVTKPTVTTFYNFIVFIDMVIVN